MLLRHLAGQLTVSRASGAESSRTNDNSASDVEGRVMDYCAADESFTHQLPTTFDQCTTRIRPQLDGDGHVGVHPGQSTARAPARRRRRSSPITLDANVAERLTAWLRTKRSDSDDVRDVRIEGLDKLTFGHSADMMTLSIVTRDGDAAEDAPVHHPVRAAGHRGPSPLGVVVRGDRRRTWPTEP